VLITRVAAFRLPPKGANDLLVLLERAQGEHVSHLRQLIARCRGDETTFEGKAMCNDYRLLVDPASIVKDFAALKIKMRFGEGIPNLESPEDIKITDMGPIVRTIDRTRDKAELVQRRWSWPGPNKRSVYNFRSEGRELPSNRCLIIADGFYEFTDAKDPKKKKEG